MVIRLVGMVVVVLAPAVSVNVIVHGIMKNPVVGPDPPVIAASCAVTSDATKVVAALEAAVIVLLIAVTASAVRLETVIVVLT